MNAIQRQRHRTTPLGERIDQRGVVATTAALIALGAAATAGGAVASSAISTRGNTKAAQTSAESARSAAEVQAAASDRAAELEAGTAKNALDFTKQQDAADRIAADQAARQNYGQWADQQRRIGTLGSMLGLGGRDPGPYESVISPEARKTMDPTGAGLTGSPQGTMPGQGEVDWTAAPQTLTNQLNAYFTKRGVGTTETPYWVSKAAELVARGKEINDPNYASTRLAQSDIFGGGGATAPTPGKPTTTASKTGLGAYVAAPYRAPGRYVQTPQLEVGSYTTGYV